METTSPPSLVAPSVTLRKTPVLLVVVLFLVTWGFYIPFWFLARRPWLNSLPATTALPRLPGIVLLAIYSIDTLVYLAALSGQPAIVALAAYSDPVVLIVGITLLLVLSFRARTILNQQGTPIYVSVAGTLLLNVFYLQFKINRMARYLPKPR